MAWKKVPDAFLQFDVKMFLKTFHWHLLLIFLDHSIQINSVLCIIRRKMYREYWNCPLLHGRFRYHNVVCVKFLEQYFRRNNKM